MKVHLEEHQRSWTRELERVWGDTKEVAVECSEILTLVGFRILFVEIIELQELPEFFDAILRTIPAQIV